MITPERMFYQAIDLPPAKPRKGWKVYTPRARLFATLEEARDYANRYAERTGIYVSIEEQAK